MEHYTAGCLCGSVRVVAIGRPYRVGICHCLDCRKHHGALFHASAIFPAAAVAITGAYRSFGDRSFCPTCGTTVSHTAELRPGMRTIAAGTFDDPTWFKIDRHIWVQSKLPWVTIPDNVATYAQGFVASPP